jgi:hypothetical protein
MLRQREQDENDYWADRRCVACDRPLDRRGSLCRACLVEEREKEMTEDPMADWQTENERPSRHDGQKDKRAIPIVRGMERDPAGTTGERSVKSSTPTNPFPPPTVSPRDAAPRGAQSGSAS